MSDWWTGIAPAEMTVDCGGARHRIRWQDGRVIAADHGDLGDERALAALGGSELECVEIARAWERHRDDLQVLVIGPRGGADELQAEADQPFFTYGRVARGPRRRPGGSATVSVVQLGSSPLSGGRRRSRFSPDPDDDTAALCALAELGSGLGERLVASVAAEWAQRLRAGDPTVDAARARLHAALYGRVAAALRGWLGTSTLPVELEMVAEGAPRSVRRVNDVIHASLPFGWLADVWARSLPVVQGRFCLNAETTDGHEWSLRTIALDLRTVERIELRIAARS